MFEHRYIVAHGFDPQNITESDRRTLIMRYYDFCNWCEKHSKGQYIVDTRYKPEGITVLFTEEEDYQKFLSYMGNEFWLFFHN